MTAQAAGETAPRSTYGTIVVVGGGCYGSYYVRQLARAHAAGAIAFERVLVVDRNPECRVAREIAAPGVGAFATSGAGAPPQQHDTPDAPAPRHPSDAVVVVRADWSDFFARYLAHAAENAAATATDAIVPSPLMPHLMFEWLRDRARARWPGRSVETPPLPSAPPTPWQRPAPDGTHYVSFAEWLCPVNCIEPARCPKTRGPRDWSLPTAIRAWVDAERAGGAPLDGPVIFHCSHRAYGVGMIDVADVVAADALVAAAGQRGQARVLVGTVSHCHGALNLLSVGG
jgi:hypothetical protein